MPFGAHISLACNSATFAAKINMAYPILRLKPNKEISITRRHPWVFSGALAQSKEVLKEGDKVQLADFEGNIMATGHFGAGSIAMRILDFAETQIDPSLYKRKFENARQLRAQLGLPRTGTTGYRLVHGEGDGLPGLVIDIYDKVAVLQSHSGGMQRDEKHIRAALKACFGDELEHIVSKSAASKGQDSPELPEGAPSSTIFTENGYRFTANWVSGQKTGFFLDQRDNRQLISQYAKGKKVLNAFCYTGGFSVYALGAGATEVHSLDSSNRALALVDSNLALNQMQGLNHRNIAADAIKYLGGEQAAAEAYDVIVLDPPAFAKHRSARHAAVQAYKRLNARAFEIASKGSIVFTFSCSQVVSTELFNHTIAAAAMESGRSIRILQQLHQPADHPVSIYHPEGEYLKGLVLAVD
jgi:23S rRNA (cytosine1962-C5)-methyltransferase